jgi:hypothetical protein
MVSRFTGLIPTLPRLIPTGSQAGPRLDRAVTTSISADPGRTVTRRSTHVPGHPNGTIGCLLIRLFSSPGSMFLLCWPANVRDSHTEIIRALPHERYPTTRKPPD